jgi:Fis family transcriptional regulator
MGVNVVRLPHGRKPGTTPLKSALSECVGVTVQRYLEDLGETACTEGLYALIMREAEVPLLREVMAWHEGNQSRAAATLGINRTTLRKKLSAHNLL